MKKVSVELSHTELTFLILALSKEMVTMGDYITINNNTKRIIELNEIRERCWQENYGSVVQ